MFRGGLGTRGQVVPMAAWRWYGGSGSCWAQGYGGQEDALLVRPASVEAVDVLAVDGEAVAGQEGGEGLVVSVENDLGVLVVEPVADQRHMLFPTLDLNVSPDWELNFGVGRGLTPVSQQWVIKTIVGYRFKR